MKKVYIVHCWEGTSNDGWYPWIAEKLSTNNVEVIKFDMPNTENPKIDEWIETLNSKVDKLNNETFMKCMFSGCSNELIF